MGVSATSLALLFGQHTCTAQAFGGPSLKGKHKHREFSREHLAAAAFAMGSNLLALGKSATTLAILI